MDTDFTGLEVISPGFVILELFANGFDFLTAKYAEYAERKKIKLLKFRVFRVFRGLLEFWLLAPASLGF